MNFISSSYDEGEIVIPTVSETEHRLVQNLYDNMKGNKHMNNDLISREALRNSLLDSRPDNIEQSDINFDTCDIKIWLSFVLKTIDNAPTVEPDKELKEKVETYKNAYTIMSDAFENEVTKNTRPQGEWLKHNTGHSIYYDCSLCGCVAPCTETADKILWKMANYCPNCGADMRNEESPQAEAVSDRYDEGFRDGYAKCINDREERKENSRLFQKGGAAK